MRANRLQLLFLALSVALLVSCKKTEDYVSEPLSDYMPLQVGKYITYRLDSTVFINFGRTMDVHSYQEKHVVESQIPDAMGRPSFRIHRFLRDTLGTQSWQPAGSYFITTLDKTLEVIEDNLRYVRLSTPIKYGMTWKPFQYLPDEPFLPLYTFQNDGLIEEWDFTYESTEEPMTFKGKTYNVITVTGKDEVSNIPVTEPGMYGSIDFHEYKYAKGLGLVYEKWFMWDWQPPNQGQPTGFYNGFGVKRSIIDHN